MAPRIWPRRARGRRLDTVSPEVVARANNVYGASQPIARTPLPRRSPAPMTGQGISSDRGGTEGSRCAEILATGARLITHCHAWVLNLAITSGRSRTSRRYLRSNRSRKNDASTGITSVRCLSRGIRPALVVTIGIALLAVTPPSASDTANPKGMRLAIDYLLGAQRPSGLFTYDFDFLEGKPKESENIVRQAAGAYVLAEYYVHARDERVRGAIEAALTTLDAQSLPIGKSPLRSLLDSIGLLSLPVGRSKLRVALERLDFLYRPGTDGKVVSADRRYANAWAGATPIALLAELQYYRASSDGRFAGQRAAWLKGLRALHVPNRGFRAFPYSLEGSPYVDGQGWLALAFYASAFSLDESLAALLTELDGNLMTRYGREFSFQFYHWGTMAAALRWKRTSDGRFVQFIRAQAQVALDQPAWTRARFENTCATLEGLATAAAVLRGRDDAEIALRRRIHERIDAEMTKNRALQIQPDQTRLQLPDGAYRSLPRVRDFSGAFLAGLFEPYTRIDLTGHCLSVMVKLAGENQRSSQR